MVYSVSLKEFPDGGAGLTSDRNTKKVHFKYLNLDSDMEMVDGLSQTPKLSWKEMLLGEGSHDQRGGKSIDISNEDKEFDLLDGDIEKSTVDGISSIDFLDRVNKILIKHMATSVVLKLSHVQKENLVGDRRNGWKGGEIRSKHRQQICFSYGQNGHSNDSCGKVEESLAALVERNNFSEKKLLDSATAVETDLFEPWMLVERRVKKQIREPQNLATITGGNKETRNALINVGQTHKIRAEALIMDFDDEKNSKALQLNKGLGDALSQGTSGLSGVLKPDGKIVGVKTRVNLAFEGEEVQLIKGVLDIGKHSAIIFRGDAHQKLHNSTAKHDIVSKYGFPSSSNDKKIVGNLNASRGGWKISNVLKGKGSRFQSTSNSQVPLTESMEVVVDLLFSQVVIKLEKGPQGAAASNMNDGSSHRYALIKLKRLDTQGVFGWDGKIAFGLRRFIVILSSS
ncbi:hypothetical protein Golob_003847 [Gossypium lobatum]|uniref:Uncharacterized protein n=1 Tax=Gossypium lobatum TaxID=34289 RepID=A0A7J8MZT1_9ROSI|nr:hypothetical protein [Gossypium lobatum]